MTSQTSGQLQTLLIALGLREPQTCSGPQAPALYLPIHPSRTSPSSPSSRRPSACPERDLTSALMVHLPWPVPAHLSLGMSLSRSISPRLTGPSGQDFEIWPLGASGVLRALVRVWGRRERTRMEMGTGEQVKVSGRRLSGEQRGSQDAAGPAEKVVG